MTKKHILVGLLFLFLLMPVYAVSLKNFDISINISSPEKATIIELWDVEVSSEKDLSNFKNSILKNSSNLEELRKINPDLNPHIFIEESTIKFCNFF